jgi:hypothetical protein
MSIEAALKTGKPLEAISFITQGWIIGPHHVEVLLEETEAHKIGMVDPEIESLRKELAQARDNILSKGQMSAEKLFSMPLNHADNPMGPLEEMENAFQKLCETWADKTGQG